MPRVLLALAMLALTIYAAVDCVQTEESSVRGLPKIVWVLLILLFPPAGPIAWFLAGRPKAVPRSGRAGPGGFGRDGRPSGPRGPDDDPDFLRNI
ncbi:MAG TPA: PLD nuclease N-terminal domain-containing protein [Dermatophilaceae bacterium]|nr:PLD nuclease N-terminal domain-containing protein [Dermatophilaceae bacterium]